jgi:hypothetical protein
MSLYTADMACDVDNVVKLFGNVKAVYNIDFHPNLLPGGVTVKTQDQGLVTVVATGTTIHQNTCGGAYQQSFVFIRDPLAVQTWKIKHTEQHIKMLTLITSRRTDV